MTLSKVWLRIVLGGAACVAGAALSTVSAPSASAEPTGCVAGSAFVVAASYCSGGTGEHRVEAACVVPSLYATLFTAPGPWTAPGQLSVVTIGAPTTSPTAAGSCVLPVFAGTGTR
ncbi:hypothetical protein [Gordonia terrae]|uniref:Secreted protein n=2 Tax=Gordonia terrae TaxID=2055 RepID=A0AAD0K9C7_9ACTN|nr:hypothetical protein [Gordonia terrae]ANY22502.1 hypothetical protein BCM27_06515 [Gordonia terrae]AWO83239.1 hypothetical protein DLJ61_06570 [Gordonia terrae]GAB43425.1 hypothetical protein GOTRE_039_02660 [Gordonia terrae NBRC 100016]VTR06795.1 Uncharacterised protein [Clostridioides difficile]